MKLEDEPHMAARILKIAGSLVVLSMLGACVAPPVRTVAVPLPPTPPQRVFVHPAKGQSADQLERDRSIRRNRVAVSRPATACAAAATTIGRCLPV